MHPAITDHPGWEALDAEDAELTARHAAIVAAGQRARAAARDARVEYERALDAAIDAGETPPRWDPPPAVDMSSRLHQVVVDRQRLRARRRDFLRDHADELLPALEDAVLDVVARAAPVVAELERLLPEYAAAAEAQEAIAQAAGRRAVVGSGLADLIYAVGAEPAAVSAP